MYSNVGSIFGCNVQLQPRMLKEMQLSTKVYKTSIEGATTFSMEEVLSAASMEVRTICLPCRSDIILQLKGHNALLPTC